jgi:hypothetical protein
MVILLMAIILMAIDDYYIYGYLWLFLLMAIGGYYIYGYLWLFY